MKLNKDNLQKVKVEQLANKNQFVITYVDGNKTLLFFQSYRSLVAVYDTEDKTLYVSWQYWDYSKTTSKHFKMFVNEFTPYTYDTKAQFIKEIKNNPHIELI